MIFGCPWMKIGAGRWVLVDAKKSDNAHLLV